MPDMSANIDAIVVKLQERWPYIDIRSREKSDADDWRELVRDVLEIAADLEKP